jgi:GTP-binding protein|uniref:GTPase Der n=1 Tax=candidate division WOR-3 bacterium TaxID=2052148 RepID=A0A7V3PS80_UNCW3
MTPAVVIVGRPNVGKSTLFNRMVGGRVAITLKDPGVTRDRLIKPCHWRDREFLVIDTGGYVPDSDAEIQQEITRQVEIALQEAAVVIMVVDGTTGLVPLDIEIASRLRARGKKFLLAVNKCDIKRRFDETEFYRLGAEKLFIIAAEHGTGVDELLDEIVSQLPPAKIFPRPGLALAILGRPNVGKSTLLNQLLGRERAIVTTIPGTTRDTIEEIFEFEGETYRIIDTAGIRRRPRIEEPVEYYSVSRAIDTIENCDIALVVIDATEGPTAQDKRIINLVTDRNRGLVIVANKTDLIPPELRKKVTDYITTKLQFVNYAPLVYTCALRGKGVWDAVQQAKAVYHSGAMRISSRFLRATILAQLQEQPPAPKCRVISLSQTDIRPPWFRLRVSQPEEVGSRYQRFVINLIRNQFRFTGYPIRLKVTD